MIWSGQFHHTAVILSMTLDICFDPGKAALEFLSPVTQMVPAGRWLSWKTVSLSWVCLGDGWL